jgi:beta-phosphoglucomutase family hydrolase
MLVIKGVIFDMDGVLIDSEPMHYKVFMQYAKEFLSLEIASEEYNSFIGSTNTHMFTFLKDKYNLKQAVSDMAKEYDQKIEEFLLSTNETIAPIDGVDVLVSQLYKENIKLAVASSSEKNRIDIVIDMFGMDKYFSAKISGQQVKHSKPAPDIFLLAAKTLGLDPEECAVIEDSKNGVAAAKAAGMKCIGYTNPNSGNQDISRADRIIDNFAEINHYQILALAEK